MSIRPHSSKIYKKLFWAAVLCPAFAHVILLFKPVFTGNWNNFWGASLLDILFIVVLTDWPYVAAVSAIALIAAVIFWRRGIRHQARFPKTILASGIAVIIWPALVCIPELPMLYQITSEAHKTNSLYDKAVVNAVHETPITAEGSPVGLHIDMDMTVPAELVSGTDEYGQVPSEYMNYFCQKDFPGGSDGLLRAGLSGVKTGFSIIPLNIFNDCTEMPGGMSKIRFRNDFYPAKIQYVEEKTAKKICMATDRPTQSDPYAHGTEEKMDLDWEVVNTLAVKRVHNQKSDSSDFSSTIANHFDRLSDPYFWKQVYQSLSPDGLRSLGYQPCKVEYPGYNPLLILAPGKLMGPTDYDCYCAVGLQKDSNAGIANTVDYSREAQVLSTFFPDHKVERVSVPGKNNQITGTRLIVHTQQGDKIYEAPLGYDDPFMATNYYPQAQLLVLRNYLNDSRKMLIVVDMQTGQEIKDLQDLQDPLIFTFDFVNFAYVSYAEECLKKQAQCPISIVMVEKKDAQSRWEKSSLPAQFNPGREQPFKLRWKNDRLAVVTCNLDGSKCVDDFYTSPSDIPDANNMYHNR